MQILRWLRKPLQDHSAAATTRCRSKRESGDEPIKPRDLVIYSGGGASQRRKEEEDEEAKKRTFTILLRGEDSRTCFYGTLHRTHLRSLYKDRDPWHPVNSEQRMGRKAESANVGCKVLPISCDGGDSSDASGKDARKGEPRKAVSRMKELVRWTAAAKSHKDGSKGWKVLYFRNRAALKAQVDGSSSSSSKISFRWDVGGCSTSPSAHSPLSPASMPINDQKLVRNSSNLSANHLQGSERGANMLVLVSPKTEDNVRTGRWITTDSDFVVLEL